LKQKINHDGARKQKCHEFKDGVFEEINLSRLGENKDAGNILLLNNELYNNYFERRLFSS